MIPKLRYLIFIMFLMLSCQAFAQDVSLYQQFNGRYEFVFFGNTMNEHENGTGWPCQTGTESTAPFNLAPTNVIEKAFLYWAGSGSGDFDISLNGQPIAAQRTFNLLHTINGIPNPVAFFSAFADVTDQILATGNGNYTVSGLDVTPFLGINSDYCNSATNFAGWAIVIIYKNDVLPLNQVNVYDGLQDVPEELNITLDALHIIDNVGSKIGFVAWEGDQSLADGETLTINEHPVSNALNPVTNAFNGTNSFTGATNLYNMDLDVYDVQGFINIGAETADIKLTSNRDFVMINTVVTKFISQLPDAIISTDNVAISCNSRQIRVDYTVSNIGTDFLPALTRIAFYANGQFLQSAQTTTVLDIDESESGQISLLIPEGIPDDFELKLVVDDNGSGHGAVAELSETNNGFVSNESFLPVPEFKTLPEVNSCNEGLGRGTYDFVSYIDAVKVNPDDTAAFYRTEADAINGTNEILNPQNYTAPESPTTIYIRLENELGCYSITSFLLITKNCPPTVYNYISANNDGKNDDFFIKGLRDIFLNFKLYVYNRWGTLVWTGNNNMPNWTGNNNEGFIPSKGTTADGTYFYLLELNDPDYPELMQGFLYINR